MLKVFCSSVLVGEFKNRLHSVGGSSKFTMVPQDFMWLCGTLIRYCSGMNVTWGRERRNRWEILQHDRLHVGAEGPPHQLPGDLSASVAANKEPPCPVLWSGHWGPGALGMTCKPHTSLHSVCYLISLFSSSVRAPQRQPSPHGAKT